MEQYNVTGMSCAACQTRVEKAVCAVDGVESCAVSLLTNSMGVEGSASPRAIISAVEAAGYGASLKEAKSAADGSGYEDSLKDNETPKMIKRLVASVVLLIPLMYVSMGHMMWDWPLPGFLNGNHVAMGIAQMLLAGIFFAGCLQGCAYADYDPRIIITGLPPTPLSLITMLTYTLFALIPILLAVLDQRRWALLRRDIQRSTRESYRLWEVNE